MSKPVVLFVCVKNGGKSQLAAALLRQKMGDRVEVLSGGTEPGEQIPPLVIDALTEVGASVEGEHPKKLTYKMLQQADLTVVLGDEARVTPVPRMSGPIETWATDEPSERGIDGIERMRLVRDDIDRQINLLVPDLERVADLADGREVGQLPVPGQAPNCVD